MKRFDERDIRRFYDLLQHDSKHGLTQLNAMDGENLIGIGLFDNEEDFVSECKRYNTLGALWVGVNPRSKNLLDEYGGLLNRMRTLIIDVVSLKDVVSVTGFVASEPGQLTEAALAYQKDVSVLGDGAFFFPMDKPISIEDDRPGRLAKQVAQWFFGEATLTKVDLLQMVPIPGIADPEGTWFQPRVKFSKYRPYILDGIATAVRGEEEEL
jgi:hypothetical protein